MPELPEAEMCRRQLASWAEGQTLTGVRVIDEAVVRHKVSTRPSDKLEGGVGVLEGWVGRTAGAPVRHGKRLGWSFGDDGLLIHLGMTGRWVRRPASDPHPRNTRIGLVFGDEVLWMIDTRRFACVVPIPLDDLDLAMRQGHGPDALLEPMGGSDLAAAFRTKRPIKVVLMEQKRIAGLGNIHAAEACFRAGVSPGRPANALSADEWDKLASGIVAQLQGTIDDIDLSKETVYVSEGGENPFSVYKRTGQPCPSCGTVVVSEEMGGRTTYWCPSCQPS